MQHHFSEWFTLRRGKILWAHWSDLVVLLSYFKVSYCFLIEIRILSRRLIIFKAITNIIFEKGALSWHFSIREYLLLSFINQFLDFIFSVEFHNFILTRLPVRLSFRMEVRLWLWLYIRLMYILVVILSIIERDTIIFRLNFDVLGHPHAIYLIIAFLAFFTLICESLVYLILVYLKRINLL